MKLFLDLETKVVLNISDYQYPMSEIIFSSPETLG